MPPLLNQQCHTINQFLSQFTILQHSPNSTIISSKSNHTYLIRNIQINTQIQSKIITKQHINQIIQTLTQHQLFNSNHISPLLQFQIINQNNQSQYSIRAIYQYGTKTLQSQIQKRNSNNEYFQEDALWGLLYSLTTPLNYLEQKNIIYGVIDPQRIFLDQAISLLDPSSTAIDPYQIQPNRLYSPELLDEYRSIQNINMFKSDVFTLGMLMLQSALLKSEIRQYNKKIIEELLNDLLSANYSEQFKEILSRMLSFQPDQRPSFGEILKSLSDMFEISTSQVQIIEPMKPDSEEAPNELIEYLEYRQEEKYDILIDQNKNNDFLQQDQIEIMTQYQKARMKLLGLDHYYSQKFEVDQESIHLSPSSSFYMQDATIKQFSKTRRAFKPKQIKEKLIKQKDDNYHTEKEEILFIIRNRHKRSNTNHEVNIHGTNDFQPLTTRDESMNKISNHSKNYTQLNVKQNDKNRQNKTMNFDAITHKYSFGQLNKENLFTKPQLMKMIKNDIKRIEENKKIKQSNLQ